MQHKAHCLDLEPVHFIECCYLLRYIPYIMDAFITLMLIQRHTNGHTVETVLYYGNDKKGVDCSHFYAHFDLLQLSSNAYALQTILYGISNEWKCTQNILVWYYNWSITTQTMSRKIDGYERCAIDTIMLEFSCMFLCNIILHPGFIS